jgi:3-isopropylmalate dehydrogenase
MAHKIVTLPGDGIGPEIMAPALELLRAVGEFELEEHPFGGACIDLHGTALTDDTLQACRRADAVLLAAVGGPKWDTTDPGAPRPEQGLLGLRKGLGLYANLRPVKPLPALYDASPLRRERIEGTDLLVVRELTGGIYFGEKVRRDGYASDLCAYTREEIERIARVAFQMAVARDGAREGFEAQARQGRRERGVPIGDRRDLRSASTRATEGAASRRSSKVSSVDKANVLESSRLWREVVSELHSREFPHVELEHVLVDNAAMQLVASPRRFDVLLTENMFGDILSDEAAMLTGSIGMLPSASLSSARPAAASAALPQDGASRSRSHPSPAGAEEEASGGRCAGLFEPVHGSAPDIAGQGIANPLAMFLSVALMLRHGLGLEDEAAAVESAVERALDEGLRTPDLGGEAGTAEATRAVLAHL